MQIKTISAISVSVFLTHLLLAILFYFFRIVFGIIKKIKVLFLSYFRNKIRRISFTNCGDFFNNEHESIFIENVPFFKFLCFSFSDVNCFEIILNHLRK